MPILEGVCFTSTCLAGSSTPSGWLEFRRWFNLLYHNISSFWLRRWLLSASRWFVGSWFTVFLFNLDPGDYFLCSLVLLHQLLPSAAILYSYLGEECSLLVVMAYFYQYGLGHTTWTTKWNTSKSLYESFDGLSFLLLRGEESRHCYLRIIFEEASQK